MNAADTIETLVKLGVSLKDAFSKATKASGSLDWGAFLGSDAFKAAETEVEGLLGQLTSDDVQGAIVVIRQKEDALRGGKPLSALSTDKLKQYSDLVDAETALADQEVKNIGKNPTFFQVLVNDVLPVLLRVASVVIPLVV